MRSPTLIRSSLVWRLASLVLVAVAAASVAQVTWGRGAAAGAAVAAAPRLVHDVKTGSDRLGSLTPATAHDSPQQVLHAVTAGRAVVGILPLPDGGDPQPWWPMMLAKDPKHPRVVVRRLGSGASGERRLGAGADGEALAAVGVGSGDARGARAGA